MSSRKLPMLVGNETFELPALNAELPAESLELLAAATGFARDGSVVLREYARALWAVFDEVLAVTTNYRTRILRPIDRPMRFIVEGTLRRSWTAGERHFVDVSTRVRKADSRELLVDNSTTMLIVGEHRSQTSGSAQRPPTNLENYRQVLRSDVIDRSRILWFETATSLVWSDHPVTNIHTDARRSAQTGLADEVFASGMMATSVITGALRQEWPDWSDRFDLDVRFRRPVVEGTNVRVFVSESDLDLSPLEIVCVDSAGEIVVEAQLVTRSGEPS